MPHPVYGPPSHKLESVTLTLWLPTNSNGRHVRLEGHGRASTSRGSLWSVAEAWSPTEHRQGLEAVDEAQRMLLVALQDRPSTQNAYQQATVFGHQLEMWEQ